MAKVVAVRRDGSEIVRYKLDDGRELGKAEVVDAAMRNEIEDVLVAHSREDELYIRSLPDGDRDNNLQELPEF